MDSKETVGNSSIAQAALKDSSSDEFMAQLSDGKLLVVNSRRRNGVIIYKRCYAEFAGPGAAVGGGFDEGCQRVIPVGDLSLLTPENYEERQKAYLIRRQWIRLTQKLTDDPVPIKRVQMILDQFKNYFPEEVVAKLPDEAFALLVGVLPQTVRLVRYNAGLLNSNS
ncbi:MAG: hypothetical protein SFW36_05530 [Leptolyngbyaceae cyanobacterium bins.59]|nr:hypothetical protein [Leptolyngbyaceae cyanobacterium bins.59]